MQILQTVTLFALVLGIPCNQAISQTKADRKDEKRENERVSDAKQDVQNAQHELRTAIKALRMQTVEMKRTEDRLRSTQLAHSQAREAAEERLANSNGLPEVIRKMRGLRDEIELLSKPVMEKLHGTQRWKVTTKKAEEATEIRDKLLKDDTQTDEDIAGQLLALDKLIAAPEDMEKAAIEADPQVKRAKIEFHEALDTIAELRRNIDSTKVDADLAVKSSRGAVDAIELAFTHQRKSLATLNAKVTSAQSRFVAANRRLQQAQAADQKDSNKGN